MPAPTLTDGVVQLDELGPGDVDAHLANEDEEMARRFGWWPKRSTADDVRAAFERWAESWARGGSIRVFAVRDVATATLVGSCELRLEEDEVVADAKPSARRAALRPAGDGSQRRVTDNNFNKIHWRSAT